MELIVPDHFPWGLPVACLLRILEQQTASGEAAALEPDQPAGRVPAWSGMPAALVRDARPLAAQDCTQ